MAYHETCKGFILHARNYRETSSLVDIFSCEYGCFRAVLKGVRGKTKLSGELRAISRPFTELLIERSGKTELKSIRQIEPLGSPVSLQKKALYAGMYINELVVRLSSYDLTSDYFYECYKSTLELLSKKDFERVNQAEDQVYLEKVLRDFERNLLNTVGFSIDMESEASKHSSIKSEDYYAFVPGLGFIETLSEQTNAGNNRSNNRNLQRIKGSTVIQIANGNYENQEVRLYAKQIFRLALSQHLGDKPLLTRSLFRRSRA